jgi:Ca2+-binding EF-hand superfamily protein
MSSFLDKTLSGPKPLKSAVQRSPSNRSAGVNPTVSSSLSNSTAGAGVDTGRVISQNILGSISRPDAASLASTLSQMGLANTDHPSSALAVARAGPGLSVSKQPSRQSLFAPPDKMPVGVAHIVKKLKTSLKAHGASSFVGLQRKFRIIDDDSSNGINMHEFKKAMLELNLGLADSEIRMLFDHFDTDRNGTIDFEEFIQGVRDPLSDRRLGLVKQAFTRIDKDGNGVVDAKEVASIYDASKHPEVIAGRKTPQQILTQFFETFDVGGEVDGKV